MDGHVVKRLRVAIWSGIALVLLAPLVAMRFTDEVNWTGFDFAAAALLLGGAALAWEGVLRMRIGARTRALAGVGIAAVLLTVWAEGAVGIF